MSLAFEPSRVTLVGVKAEYGISCTLNAAIQAYGGTPKDSLLLLEIIGTFYDPSGAKLNTVFGTPMDWFGTNYLKYGERAVAHRSPGGAGPIKLEIGLRYADPSGEYHLENLSVTCE